MGGHSVGAHMKIMLLSSHHEEVMEAEPELLTIACHPTMLVLYVYKRM